MNATPYDLFYKVVSSFLVFYAIGLVEGFNQTRYFTLIVRRGGPRLGKWLHQAAMGFILLDHIVEGLFRFVFAAEETSMSNSKAIFRSAVFMGVYWLATTRNRLSQYFGTYDQKLAALTLGFGLGVANAYTLIGGEETPAPRPEAENPEPEDADQE
jgi:hypothetical protein